MLFQLQCVIQFQYIEHVFGNMHVIGLLQLKLFIFTHNDIFFHKKLVMWKAWWVVGEIGENGARVIRVREGGQYRGEKEKVEGKRL